MKRSCLIEFLSLSNIRVFWYVLFVFHGKIFFVIILNGNADFQIYNISAMIW